MSSALPLRAALLRGALIAAANWPIVLIEFAVESLYKFTLAVPIVGGALMVAVLLGGDVRALFDEGIRSAAGRVYDALGAAPVALGSFLLAFAIVGCGGAVVMFAIKAATLATVVASDRRAGEIQDQPVSLPAVRRVSAFDPAHMMVAGRHFARRAVVLAMWLGVAYAAIAAGYAGALAIARELAASDWAPAWPLVMIVATSAGLVAVVAVNLAYDLLRIVVVTDDCEVRVAAARVRRFVMQDARQVLGIFAVVGVLLLIATAGSFLTTAGLTLVAWVPLAGLLSVPLRGAAWLVQGLVWQYVSLSATAAYQGQYRRFATPARRATEGPRLLERA